MLARIQQSVVLALLLVCLFSVAYGWVQRSPWLAIAGPIAIMTVYATIMAAEFALLWMVSRHEVSGKARPGELLKACLNEILTAPRVFCWDQPFRSHDVTDNLSEATKDRCGVVLVHGFVCNRGLWNPMQRKLQAQSIPHISVNLEPVFGSIDDYTHTIESAVHRITVATGQPPVIVAHSMGGLAVRAWLQAFNAHSRVKRIITIATPHHGTYLARFSVCTNTRQMRTASPWLLAVAASENSAILSRFTCFYSNCDNIVFPIVSATLPYAENIHAAVRGHVSMVHDDRVFDEVVRWVEAGQNTRTMPANTSNLVGTTP